jgi:hypothetical protein
MAAFDRVWWAPATAGVPLEQLQYQGPFDYWSTSAVQACLAADQIFEGWPQQWQVIAFVTVWVIEGGMMYRVYQRDPAGFQNAQRNTDTKIVQGDWPERVEVSYQLPGQWRMQNAESIKRRFCRARIYDIGQELLQQGAQSFNVSGYGAHYTLSPGQAPQYLASGPNV